jgi:predicted transposase YbfD/YdcC
MRLSLFSRTAEIDPKWQSANCVVRVTRQGRREEHDFERTGYYLTSQAPNCRHLAQGIRGDWKIENRLHWVKDVIQNEDRSPQKKGLSPINISLLKTWVLTLDLLHNFFMV